MKLEALQGIIHQAMRREIGVGEAAERLGVAPERLALYQGFVQGHIEGTIDKIYARVAAYLDAETWARIKEGFYEAHPTRDWELNAAVEPFAGYLAGLDEPAITPFLVSLAQFEWAEFEVYVHPARIEPVEALSVNPTLTILELPCPVIEPVVHWDEAAPPPQTTPEQGPERILFFRDPEDMGVHFQRGIDDLIFAVKIAYEGLDPDAAATQMGVPLEAARAAMARAVDLGLVLTPPEA